MKQNRFKLKSYLALSKDAQYEVYTNIIKHSEKYFDDGFSVNLVIRKVYEETNYTLDLCARVIRSSDMCAEYRMKMNLKRLKPAEFLSN